MISRTFASRLVAAVVLGAGALSLHAQTDNRVLRFVPHANLAVLDPIWTTAYVDRKSTRLNSSHRT